MKRVIVCDDFVGDPLADVADAMEEADAPEYILLSNFLGQQGFDYDSETADLRQSGRDLPQNTNLRILDRVVELSPMTVDRIGKGEGLLQRGQILSRYQALLGRYGVPAPEMRYSTVGRLHPLPTQWHLVRQGDIPVNTPTYRYGYGPTPIEVEDLSSPVFKSPFDLYSWKPNKRPFRKGLSGRV